MISQLVTLGFLNVVLHTGANGFLTGIAILIGSQGALLLTWLLIMARQRVVAISGFLQGRKTNGGKIGIQNTAIV